MKKTTVLFLSAVLCFTAAEGCKTKSKKKPAVTTNPIPYVNPTPPPQEPTPSPTNPTDPNPIPNPGKPTPTPTDSPNPIPTPSPIPVDPNTDKPIIPTTPIVQVSHVVLNSGVVVLYQGRDITSNICRDTNVYAYYKACGNESRGLYCWEWFKPTPQCVYFICQRWGWR